MEKLDIDDAYVPDKTDASAVMTDLEIFMPLKGVIDIEKEMARLQKEIARIDARNNFV